MDVEVEAPITKSGIAIRTRRAWLVELVELVSSMRFAISLFAIIAIASMIGTVMQQNDQAPNYINKFGPFWFEVFADAGLNGVYSTWWYLGFLLVMLLSTALCVVRNAPKMLRDMNSWRDQVREQSLRNFHHHHEWHGTVDLETSVRIASERLRSLGFQTRAVVKESSRLVVGRKGAANKWGYILAHTAIVVIGIGALLDSDLSIRAQEWFAQKRPYTGPNVLLSQIPARHRLANATPTFRGNMQITEGASSDTAIIQHGEGVYLADLPFSIALKKFDIEFYSRGMPKLFASHVIVTDKRSGKQHEAVIEVNKPLIQDGYAIYQSSFEDGGSRLQLKAYAIKGERNQSSVIDGQVGASAHWGDDLTLEYSGFRKFNVENTARDAGKSPGEEGIAQSLGKQMGAASHADADKDLKNVGPSIQYKLRDKTGQAREFHTYMQPVRLDGVDVFLAGVRDSAGEPFRYLRIPADDNDAPDEWFRIRAALRNPQLRAEASARYAARQLSNDAKAAPAFRQALAASSEKGLSIFAGDDQLSGFLAVSKKIEQFPDSERERNAEIFMKILNGSMWELWQVAREHDGLPPATEDEAHGRFLQQAINAYSDSQFFTAPFYLRLQNYDEVQATVLQVTRSSGQFIVYTGCLLLVAGVFAMLFVRERRVWVWLKSADTGTHGLCAMSTQRRTLDFDQDYERVRQALLASLGTGVASAL